MPEVGKSQAVRPSAELAGLFARTGHVRCCDAKRRARDGQSYKKGYEVRFLLASEREVREARRLLCAAGLQPGKVFRKHGGFVQPVYGRAAVESFISALPAGREREASGFSPDGRRLVRRPRTRGAAGRGGLLPNTALQPAGGARASASRARS